MLMMVCIFGIVAGAVAGFSSHMSAVMSLSIPAMTPFAIHLMTQGDELRMSIGIALVIFSVLVMIAGARIGRLVREGFAHEFQIPLTSLLTHTQKINTCTTANYFLCRE